MMRYRLYEFDNPQHCFTVLAKDSDGLLEAWTRHFASFPFTGCVAELDSDDRVLRTGRFDWDYDAEDSPFFAGIDWQR